MTQEQKAKAYDEALKRAKEWKEKYGSTISSDGTMAKDFDAIIPELAESEDEKARKWIYDFIRNCPNESFEFYGGIGKKAVLAYLEKQKEHQEKCTNLLAKILKHSAEGFRNVLKKKGIDYIPHESFWISTAGTYSKEECNEFYKWMDDMTMELTTEETPEYKKGFKAGRDFEKQKEQKHPDGCFTCDEYKKGYEAGRLNGFTAGYNKAMKEQKPDSLTKYVCSKEDKKLIQDCANILVANDYSATAERLLSMFKEQKPAELEEDTQLLAGDYAISHYEQGKTYSSIEVHKMLADAFIAGKSYQKPAEWSDTKELVFKDICNHLKEEGYSGWVLLLNALRNGKFQPKQEWSEEDEARIERIAAFMWRNRKGDTDDIYLQEQDVAWLKSLRPSWKPSEEQMKVLLKAEGFLRAGLQYDSAKTIAELYEQLKKL